MLEPRRVGTSSWIAAAASDIEEGGRLIVEIDGREIGIYNIGGNYYALLNRCPHLGGPLCRGQVVTEITADVPGNVRGDNSKIYVTCPYHNWEFDITTGQSYWNEKLRARPVPVEVKSAMEMEHQMHSGAAHRVKGPYKAETIPLAVEGDLLVVTLRARPPRDHQ